MASLRQRLLAWLLPPLLVVGAVAAFGAYVFMERRLTAAYDQDLGDIARTLVPYLRTSEDGGILLDFTPQADAVLRADSADQIYYAVIDAKGRFATGDAALPLPPPFAGPGPYFWDGIRHGEAIRTVALRSSLEGSPVIVLAAETTVKRERAARDAMLSAITPVLLLSIAAIAAVIFGVRRGLGPVEQLREQLQARSHVDLRPVKESEAMEELRPLVQELNGMLARLQAAQDTQVRFIANAAHQLRTPIAGLVTQLDLARSGNDRKHLEQAREAAARLARLARQILSLAAADPISNPAHKDEDSDLAAIVKSHADQWLRSATPRDVELEFELEPAKVRGSSLLIGELATNLVDNASRYGASTVRISTKRANGRSVLEVADNGPGIPPSERAHIFERFTRLDKESTEGSGLGLAIVSEIAQRHHATVALTDGLGGAGTRIEVAFPAMMLAVLFLLPFASYAARPMITDDARVVDPKACQVESWIRRNRESTEFWALPACNPLGFFEFTFGGARVREEGENAFTDQLVQAKTILKPLENDGWGIGAAVGTIRHPRRETARGWPGDAYFYIPVSVAFRGDQWVVHVNGGAVHRRDLGKDVATWGFGNEIRLRDDLYFIPEVFRSEPGRPFYQVGFRYWVVKDRVQMDATFGNRLESGTSERWFSIGMRLLSPPLF